MFNEDILNYLCCPKCTSPLKKLPDILTCQNCKDSYKVIKDIPILLDLDELDQHYRGQIRYFQKEVDTTGYRLDEWQRSYLRRFTSSIPMSGQEVILDIGTGSGYMAVELAKKGHTVLACDLNLDGLLKLRDIASKLKLEDNLLLFACSAEKLPIRNSIIDVFISNAILEHLPSEKRAVQEIGRVAKDKAYGFVTVPLEMRYLWPFFWPVNFIHDKRIGHLRRYDGRRLEVIFAQQGFRIKNVFYTGHLVKVIGVLVQRILNTHRFDEWLEYADQKKEDKRYGASNILVTVSRG